MSMLKVTYWVVFGNGCSYEHSSLDAAIDRNPDSTTKDGILKITRLNGKVIEAAPVRLTDAGKAASEDVFERARILPTKKCTRCSDGLMAGNTNGYSVYYRCLSCDRVEA